ncbi:hypothetical protein, partial [Paenibacillus sp. S28]|uniref:hypothetical protein n=1 Tax=Paenibacillus sp. S28 TaxID=2767463 RepID=UPI001F40575B
LLRHDSARSAAASGEWGSKVLAVAVQHRKDEWVRAVLRGKAFGWRVLCVLGKPAPRAGHASDRCCPRIFWEWNER